MSSPLGDLLTTQQACDRVQVNRRTLSRWVASGRIVPAVQLPGKTGAYLFRPIDVDRAAARAEGVAS